MSRLVTISEFAKIKGIALSTIRSRIAVSDFDLACVEDGARGHYDLLEFEVWHSQFSNGKIDEAKSYSKGRKNASTGKHKVFCSEKNPVLRSFWLAGWHDWHIENRTGVYE